MRGPSSTRWVRVAASLVLLSPACATPAPTSLPSDPERDLDARPPRLATSTAAPGPAYVLADGAVLRIESSGSVTRIPLPGRQAKLDLGHDGTVWVSDSGGVFILDPTASAPRRVAPGLAGKTFSAVLARSPSDVWAGVVGPDGGGTYAGDLAHFDGARWTIVGSDPSRALHVPEALLTAYPTALVTTGRSVWMRTLHDIWRLTDGEWKQVESQRSSYLAATRDRVFLIGLGGRDVMLGDDGREIARGSGWKKEGDLIGVDRSGRALWRTEESLWVGTIDGEGEAREVRGLGGRELNQVVFDESQRIWLLTGNTILVVDRSGQTLAEYAPGTLPGFTGRVTAVVVPSAGPTTLPTASVARRIQVVGHLRVGHRTPLVGAMAELTADERVLRTAISDAGGTFRFEDVPEGLFEIQVHDAQPNAGCPPGHFLRAFDLWTSSSCEGVATGGTCDLGELRPCIPHGP